MRRFVALLAAGAVCALAVTAFAIAGATARTATTWTAALTARQEVPKQVVKKASAHGLFTATVVGNKLKWKLTYAGLTGPAIAAHIHMGAMGKAGNVVVPLCGGKPACKSGLTGTAPLTAQLKRWFRKHLLYVNVHTKKNPDGEIRGQLSAM
jgi:CHRD domain